MRRAELRVDYGTYTGYSSRIDDKIVSRCNYCDINENRLGKCRICRADLVKLCPVCCETEIRNESKCQKCAHFEFPTDQIIEDCGIYSFQGKEFYMKRGHWTEKPYEMPITFSHFLFRQSQQRIVELEEKLEKVTRTLQDLMDRIEFAPDGEEAGEAVKRWTNLLN